MSADASPEVRPAGDPPPLDAAADHRGREHGRTRGFLFADLRAYTAFVEARGDIAAARLLETYRLLVRDVVRRHDGAEIKTEGDSFYVVFDSAGAAIRCGLEIVEAATVATAAHPAQPLNVGVGVHAGETAVTAEGYVGSAVNIAARVCAQAGRGEVLVTDTVRGLVRTSGDFTFRERGRRRLKGIEEPIVLYAVTAAPSLGTAVAAGNASIPASRFWGGRPRSRAILAGGLTLAAAVAVIVISAARLQSPGPAPGPSATGLRTVDPSTAWTLLSPGDPFSTAVAAGVGASGDGFTIVGSSGAGHLPTFWDTPSGTAGSWSAWSRAGKDAPFSGATIVDDANTSPYDNPRWVIVGQACPSGPDSCRAGAWWTTDPETTSSWQAASFGAASDPAGSRVAGVGVGAHGFVAVGSTGVGADRRAAVWTSDDGATWQPAAPSGDPLTPDIRDVAGGDAGLVAVGSSGSDGAVWTSPDGTRWSAIATGGTFRNIHLVSVTRTLHGFLVVGNGPSGPGAWYSADAATWTPVTSLPHLNLVVLQGVAWNPGGGVIVTGNGPDGPVVIHAGVFTQ